MTGTKKGFSGLCLLAILGSMTPGYGAGPTITETVTNIEDKGSYSAEFQAPEYDPPWSWKLTAQTSGNWRHIQNTQHSPAGWTASDFASSAGYWSFQVTSGNVSVWRQFQNIQFSGSLRPVGEGEEPYTGSFDIAANTDGAYFVEPTSSIACVDGNATFSAKDGNGTAVNSTWTYNGTGNGTFEPSSGTPSSVTFSADQPGNYTVSGENAEDEEQTDSAEVSFVKYEAGKLARILIPYTEALGETFYHHDVLVRKTDPQITQVRRGFFADSFTEAIAGFLLWYQLPLPSIGWVDGHVGDQGDWGDENMNSVTEEKHDSVKESIINATDNYPNGYHLILYNCRDWASSQLE